MTDLSKMSDQELLAAYHQAKGVPSGATPRPEYGQRAYETPDGAILSQAPSGGVQVLRAPNVAGADARTRLNLGLGPAIAAQQQLYRSEGWDTNPQGATDPRKRVGENPYNKNAIARMLEGVPFDGGVIARSVGGDDYQAYEQAARTFEASILPIFSGAAVTDSEAKRFIRANLPQMGDTPQTLAAKAKNRAMILNAAAKMTGSAAPFPRVPAWNAGATAAPAQKPTASGRVRRYNPATGEIE